MKLKNYIVAGGVVAFMVVLSVTGDCASTVERDALLKAARDKYAAIVGNSISAVSTSSMKCSNGDSGKWTEGRVCIRSGSKFHLLIVKVGSPSSSVPIETTVSDPDKAFICFGFL